jgi:hypothetical protein
LGAPVTARRDFELMNNQHKFGTTSYADHSYFAEREQMYDAQQRRSEIIQDVAAACFNRNGNGFPDRRCGERQCKVRMASGEILLCGFELALEAIINGKGELVVDRVAEIIAGDPPRRIEDCPPPVVDERNTHADPPRERPTRSRK